MATGYKAYTTTDKAWTYGYGEYNKKLSDASGVSAYEVSTSIYKSLPWPLSTLYKKYVASKATTALTAAVASEPALVPTYYIWAFKPGSDVKARLAGEWYFDSSVRDTYFAQFAKSFDAGISDAVRVVIISQFYALKQPFSVTGLAKSAQNAAVSTITKATEHPPATAGSPGSKSLYILLTLGGIAFITYLLRRR